MFFMSNEFGIMAEFALGVNLWWFLGFRKHSLSTTDGFERSYVISLR